MSQKDFTQIRVSNKDLGKLKQSAKLAGFTIGQGRGSGLQDFLRYAADQFQVPDSVSPQSAWMAFYGKINIALNMFIQDMKEKHNKNVGMLLDSESGRFEIKEIK